MTFGYQILGFGAFPNRGASGYTIENAVMLDGAADYLSHTPASVGNNQIGTISFWVKRNKIG